MNERAAKDVIKKIAKREGKSESEIREEMEKAIRPQLLISHQDQ